MTTKVDIFLSEPMVVDFDLPSVNPEQLRFAYRLQLEDLESAEPGQHQGSDSPVLEEIFRIFNIEHPADYRNRSLSIGDVVTIDEARSYRCACVGWELLGMVVTPRDPHENAPENRPLPGSRQDDPIPLGFHQRNISQECHGPDHPDSANSQTGNSVSST